MYSIEQKSIKSVTHFEELSIEIRFDIFDFLDSYYVFEAFSNLNIHFQRLLTSTYLSGKLTIPLMSKSAFKNRSKYITPNIHRLVSLQLSEPFFIEHFFKSFPIDLSFKRLEMLKLSYIKSNNVVPILTGLVSLPRLFSLTMICYEDLEEEYIIHQLIFRLPVLKFAKLFFGDFAKILPLTLSTTDEQRSNTLEHLVIDSHQSPSSLYTLLSYMPQLRRLSADWIVYRQALPTKQLIFPLNLTHLSLSHWFLSFNEFESLISIIGSQLELLYVSLSRDMHCLNAHRWQQLISRHMPRLFKFIFHYGGPTVGNTTCQQLIDQFSSSFWVERKWFFAHRHRQVPNEEYIRFYSIQPQR